MLVYRVNPPAFGELVNLGLSINEVVDPAGNLPTLADSPDVDPVTLKNVGLIPERPIPKLINEKISAELRQIGRAHV